LPAKRKRLPNKYLNYETQKKFNSPFCSSGAAAASKRLCGHSANHAWSRGRSGHRHIRWLYTRRLRVPDLHSAFASGGKRNTHGPKGEGNKDESDGEDGAGEGYRRN